MENKIIEAVVIDEAKTYKNMFGGRFNTKKKVGETDFYDVWIAQDVNAGIQIVLLADKNNPKSCVALSWDEVESLPGILKKALTDIHGQAGGVD